MINYPKLKNTLRDLMSQTKVCIDSMLIGVEDILCVSVDSKDNVALLFYMVYLDLYAGDQASVADFKY